MSDAGYVFVLRDPDSSNDIQCIGCDPKVIDIDLGRMDLYDPEEWADWIEGHIDSYMQIGDPKARSHYERVLESVAEQFHHESPFHVHSGGGDTCNECGAALGGGSDG